MAAFTERMSEGEAPLDLQREHRARYRFASSFGTAKRVLDAACGDGYGSEILAATNASGVVGCDSSWEAVNSAHQKRHNEALNFFRADVCCLPFRTGIFDLYVSFETIEHVRRPDALLKEAFRVTKPLGLLVLSTPNRLAVHPGSLPSSAPLNPFHVMEFDFTDLTSALQRNGFAICDLYCQIKLNALGVRLWHLGARSSFIRKSARSVSSILRRLEGNGGVLGRPPRKRAVEVAPCDRTSEPVFWVVVARRTPVTDPSFATAARSKL